MTTYPKLILVLLFSCFTSAAFAQSFLLSGKVYNQADERAIEFSSVALIRLPDSVKSGLTMTSEKGAFSFEKVKPGRYLLKIIAIGYQGFSGAPFEVSNTPLILPAISLIPGIKTLQEVAIAAKSPLIEQQADRTVLNVEQMNTAGDNALEVLKKAPGVQLDKDENLILKGKRGINVMIDGKMSYRSGMELTTFLKSLPGATISKIELISNPPSSFDAAGAAGIINIKLKRNKMQGINGSANIGAGYGKYGKGYGGTNLNFNSGKFSSYARINYGYYNSFNRLTFNRTITGEQFNQINFWHPITKSTDYTFGTDYFLNERHTIGVLWKGDHSPYTTNGGSTSINYDVNQQKSGSVTSQNPQDNVDGNHAFNLNYRFKIDTSGRELGFDADYVHYNNSRTEQYLNTYFDAADGAIGAPVHLRNKGVSGVTIYVIKADYVHPFSKTLKGEAGFKSSWVQNSNDARFDSLKTAGWLNDPKRTNVFSYREHINAGYISMSQSFKNLDFKAGLRAEQTIGNGNSSGTNDQIDRNYWQLFPTFFASWKPTENHQLQGSYARRINRPAYSSLNPFTMYSDPYTASKGNPLLLPSLANNFELNYTYKNFRILTVSFSKSTDVIFPLIYQNDQTKESITMQENLGKAKNLYLATGSPFNFTKWWNNNTELSMSYDEVNSAVQNNNYNSNKISWSVNSDQTFTLPKEFKITLSAYYGSPSVDGLFRSLESYQIDMGAKKTFMGKKATISLKLNDAFDTNKFRAYLKYNNVNTYWQNQWESRKISLSLNYKFGNMKIKTARTRNTSTGEEEQRVKNN